MPKVSVVVPVYNVKDYLSKCFDSILAQTITDFELIIVDDGSTDISGNICDEYEKKDSRITVIHQENAGLGGARNTGLKKASGKYILFVDSDDYIEPDLLKITLNKAYGTNADIVVFDYRTVNDKGDTLHIFNEGFNTDKIFFPQKDKQVLLVTSSACNKLYKTELFEKGGILYPSKVWYEDLRTTPKLFAIAEKVVFTDDILYNYFVREGSIMQSGNAERNRELFDALDDLTEHFKRTGIYEKYKDELEFTAVDHILITATVRMLKIDKRNPLVKKFRSYTEETFPVFRKNPYINTLSFKRKIVYRLILLGWYRLVNILLK